MRGVAAFIIAPKPRSASAATADAADAADAGKLGIGVDSNQNHLHPGAVLTSMVKRVGLAVLSAFKGVKPGRTALRLKDGALDGLGRSAQRFRIRGSAPAGVIGKGFVTSRAVA